MEVIKRDGTVVPFDQSKIEKAIQKAFVATTNKEWSVVTNLTQRVDVVTYLTQGVVDVVTNLTQGVVDRINDFNTNKVSIEEIQDIVESVLMANGHVTQAKAYILYRDNRTKLRKKHGDLTPDISALSEYIHYFKYARYLPDKQRRETYLETSHRCRDMHLRRFCGGATLEGWREWPITETQKELYDKIMWAWDFVDRKIVLPSMRSMQFGGEASEVENCRIYNCNFTHIDRPRVFQELFYLLLCGCGVGFSVQRHHVARLPKIQVRDNKKLRHYIIPDDIQGWADSISILMDSFFSGYQVEFSYHLIRPQGSPLKRSGGKAPGHYPLKKLHQEVSSLLTHAVNRQLRPIECHDIICHIADSVLSGGIRRSSLISLFSPDDEEMLMAKHPGNFEHYGENGQRALANNSVVLLRSKSLEASIKEVDEKHKFLKIMRLNKENPNGEPGFFFTNNLDYGCNPCGEIGLYPVLEEFLDEEMSSMEVESGVAFCNLTEVNCAAIKTEKEFYDAVKAATIIGTLQAAYTDMPYLGKVTEEIAKRDALLGVSLTGMMDNPNIALNPEIQYQAAKQCGVTNREIAKLIDIKPAKRLTTVKPSGTASLLLGGVSSGIHPHHSKKYFRRVTANANEPVVKEFQKINPHMVEFKPNGDASIVFPVKTPTGGATLETLSVTTFLKIIFETYEHWISPGTVDKSLGLTHNISCTACFKPEEYEEMVETIWHNRHRIAAMSFIPWASDKKIPFIPRESVVTELDEERWVKLVQDYKPIDYSQITEEGDRSNLTLELACTIDEDCGVSSVTLEDTVEILSGEIGELPSDRVVIGSFKDSTGKTLNMVRRV